MRTKAILSTCLAMSLIFSGCGKKAEEIPQSPLDRAFYLTERYNFTGADSAFAEHEQANPEQPWVRYGEALAAEQQFLYWDALPAYFKITERFPDFLPAQEGKMRIITRLGYPDIAAAAMQTALDTAAGSAEVYYELGRTLAYSHNYSAARGAFERAQEIGLDEGSAAFELGAVLAMQNNRDSARLVAATGFEVPDTTAPYFQSGADFYEAVGQIDSAMQWSRRAWDAPDADYSIRTEHFFRSLRLKYSFDARKYMYGETDRGANDSVRAAMRIFYGMGTGNAIEAKMANDLVCFYKLGWASCNGYLLWTYPAAFEYVTPAQLRPEVYSKLLSPEKAPEFNRFGRFYFEVMLVDWLAQSPKDIELDKIEGEYVDRPEVVLAELHAMRSIGDFERYDKRLAAVEKDHGKDAAWLERIGDHFGHRGVLNWKKVEEYYLKSLEVDNYNRSAFSKLVEHYRFLRQWENALALFDKYPQFSQLFPEEAVRHAVCLINDRQTDAGVAEFEADIPLLRGNLTYFEEVLYQYRHDYDQERARRLAELCLAFSAENVDGLLFAAKVYGWLGDFENALTVSKKAAVLEPESKQVKAYVALAKYRTGDKEEGIKVFEDILAQDREQLEANLFYSQILASEQVKVLEAQNMARIAMGRSTFELYTWLNLIRVYEQTGRYDLARGEAIKASRKYQSMPLPLYHLGVANLNQGQLEEVREPLEAAIALGLSGPELEEARAILSRL